MNCLADSIARICQDRLLDEKWLFVPSLRVGRQWLDTVARQGTPVVNIHLKTLHRIAHEWAAPQLIRQERRSITPMGGLVLIERIWNRHHQTGPGYLWPLAPSVNLFQNLYATIQSIRMAGLQNGDLAPDRFESPVKAEEILTLLSDYQEAMEIEHFADSADFFYEAIAILEHDPGVIPNNCLFLIPEDMEFSGLEKRLLNAFPEDRIVRLAVDEPVTDQSGVFVPKTDLDCLRWLTTPSNAPKPFEDETVNLFHAVGEVNEIRDVFRQCVERQIPLDHVEILYTDSDTYIPLIYEPSKSLWEGDLVTFAEGIPVRYSKPGRAFPGWLRWIADGFPQASLLAMIRDETITISNSNSDECNSVTLANLLARIPILFGRDRYRTKIQEHLNALDVQMCMKHDPDSEEDADDSDRQQILEREYRLTERLQSFLNGLLDVTPGRDAAPSRILDCACQFLDTFASGNTELDNNSRRLLIKQLNDIKKWIAPDTENISFDLFGWMQSISNQLRVLGSGPRPGRIHADRIGRGGHSGRPYTFIVGLDDNRFPGAGIQDPILLDHERTNLSGELQTSSSRQYKKLQDFYRLLARLRGTVCFSYSSLDIQDDREKFPSTVFLSAFRIVTGNPAGDHSALLEWLPQPASFAPARSGACLTESEWWLAAMARQSNGRNPANAVLQRYPHLNRGLESWRERMSDEFTIFDGKVRKAGVKLDPALPAGSALSASKLELLGRCPLAFFFRYGLDLKPPGELEIDPDRWLDPMAFGSLMHYLFELFMKQLTEHSLKPNYDRDWSKLETLLERLASHKRMEIPPPNENAYRNQVEQLRRCATVFLKDEEILCQKYTPLYFETAIGLRNPGERTPLDTPMPVVIHLPGGISFKAIGVIDRIDRVGDESEREYAIWDYKSGGTYKYRDLSTDPFGQGRVIQHGLYLDLASRRLQEQISTQAKLTLFGFFFPSEKGQGERIEFSPHQLTDRHNILYYLCQLVRTGVFCPTNKADDCAFCDYLPICRDPNAVSAASQAMLENKTNKNWLEPLMKLRGIDE